MTDESIMPFGKHKDKQLADVPADYLMYLYENGLTHRELCKYIEENLDVIKTQIKREQLKKNRS